MLLTHDSLIYFSRNFDYVNTGNRIDYGVVAAVDELSGSVIDIDRSILSESFNKDSAVCSAHADILSPGLVNAAILFIEIDYNVLVLVYFSKVEHIVLLVVQ